MTSAILAFGVIAMWLAGLGCGVWLAFAGHPWFGLLVIARGARESDSEASVCDRVRG